jgi:hypothetical protein
MVEVPSCWELVERETFVVSSDSGAAAFVWLPMFYYVERETLIFHYHVLPSCSISGSDPYIPHLERCKLQKKKTGKLAVLVLQMSTVLKFDLRVLLCHLMVTLK